MALLSGFGVLARPVVTSGFRDHAVRDFATMQRRIAGLGLKQGSRPPAVLRNTLGGRTAANVSFGSGRAAAAASPLKKAAAPGGAEKPFSSGGFLGAMKRQWNPTVGLGVAVIEEFVLGLVVLGLACGVPGNTSMAMIGLVSVIGFSWDLIGDLSLSGMNLGSIEQQGVEFCTCIHSSHCLIAAGMLTASAGN